MTADYKLPPALGAVFHRFDRGDDLLVCDATQTGWHVEKAVELAKTGDHDFLIAAYDQPDRRALLSSVGKVFHLSGWPYIYVASSEPLYTEGLEWVDKVDERIQRGIEVLPESAEVIKGAEGEEEHYVLGAVLVPEETDLQGDIYSADEVRKACFSWIEDHGAFKIMHKGRELADNKVKVLENFIAPCSYKIGATPVKQGTWMLGLRIVDKRLWSDIKEGRWTGYSIGGEAKKKPA